MQVNLKNTEQRLNNIFHEPVILFDGNVLNRVSEAKILGLKLDEHLRWNERVNYKHFPSIADDTTSQFFHVPG